MHTTIDTKTSQMTDLPDYEDRAPAPLAAAKPAWMDIPLDDLSSLIFDTAEELADRRKALEPMENTLHAMRAHLLQTMVANKTTIVAHDTLDIHIEEKKRRDIRVSELVALTKLEAYRTDRDFKAAVDKFVYEFQADPTWKWDLRYVRGVKKYGPAVSAIVDKGVVELEPERRLVMQPKPTHRSFKNVTPEGAYDGGGCV